jgi:hypothetical protein
MRRGLLSLLLVLCPSLLLWSQNPGSQAPPQPQSGGDFSTATEPTATVPQDMFIKTGPLPSASNSMPVPEGGSIADNVLTNQYFGIAYAFPQDWYEKYQGPPPTVSGHYEMARLRPKPTFKGPDKGTIMITADDLFFTTLPVKNALELANYTQFHMQTGQKVELKPTAMTLGGRPFTFFSYWSPEIQVHWYVVVTQIRCHTVQFVLGSHDTKMLENLMRDLDKMKQPNEATGSGGGQFPVCIKDYANTRNLIQRVDPVFTTHTANAVPVRIIIDKEGRVKHIHFISAFPDQAEAITEAMGQWRFKPFLQDGKPVEVETGILFGHSSNPTPGAKVPTAD